MQPRLEQDITLSQVKTVWDECDLRLSFRSKKDIKRLLVQEMCLHIRLSTKRAAMTGRSMHKDNIPQGITRQVEHKNATITRGTVNLKDRRPSADGWGAA